MVNSKYYSSSKQLIKNTQNFLNISYYYFIDSLLQKKGLFYGWGRKSSGLKAVSLAKKYNTSFILLEDGFIRSIGLGVNGSSSLSLVEDDVGIYYDATAPSKLENILNTYDFNSDKRLMLDVKKAISLIQTYHISKYNNALDIDDNFFQNSKKEKVLIIAQTAGDSSLEYGMLENFTTDEMIQQAFLENKDADIYIKIHPDVLSGKKKSDIDIGHLDTKVKIIKENLNPISLLKHFKKVYTKTSGMGFEALLVGCECVCFGMPFYAGWGITTDKSVCSRRKRVLSIEEVFAGAYILYTRYYNLYTKKDSDIFDTIKSIIKYKSLEQKKDKEVFLFGFSRWKHIYMLPFLQEYKKENIYFINPILNTHLQLALKKGLNKDSDILIWGRKEFLDIENFSKINKNKIIRVEDGFIRSVGLGSDLTQPFSLVFDDEGIYFDPTKSSRLEKILNKYDFKNDIELIKQAKDLKQKIIKTKVSKYNSFDDAKLYLPKDKNIILVVGQVQDDASIKYGANGMTNLELLKDVYRYNKNSYIIYKPHPDVLSGNRVGGIVKEEALKYCDDVVENVGLHSVLNLSDEVHTMTSLTGFEALVLGKKVFTYGMPFYAGWGLSVDKKQCSRRTRELDIDELIAATFILYPRYIDPNTKNYCEADVLIDAIQKQKHKMDTSIYYNYKMKIYSVLSRNIQKLLNVIK